jgi:hypothetical protein
MGKTAAMPPWKTPPAFPTFPQLRRPLLATKLSKLVVSSRERKKGADHPDQAAINTEIVPANTKRIAVTPSDHQTNKAVDKKHGTKKPRRKGAGGDERA